MERLEFDSKTGPNSNLKNGLTRRGAIELYPWTDHQGASKNLISVAICGPEGADRGAVIIDKATAGKLGAALLKWAEGEDTLMAAARSYVGETDL